MTLFVNGNKKTFDGALKLDALLRQLELQVDRKGVALCVNLRVVPRESWSGTELSDGDRIEIVIAAPGG